MAIEFNCPHCKTHYRLKDEFGGKTATCKNPNCRKVIPIPKPTGAAVAASPADLDALAAAAFSDELAKVEQAEEMIQVTCSGCDHIWSVEASKEGKNVLCPECRRPNRVPIRKKEEKADWRTGGGGPSMAKRETGLDREGAWATAQAGGITGDTAREIVKGREAEEEPEERRKRRIKRAGLVLLLAAVLGTGGYFAFKSRQEARSDANMAEAVKELTERGKDASGRVDPRMEAIIHRASAEYRARTSGSPEDAKGALDELKLALNKAKASAGAKVPAIESEGLLSEVAKTVPALLWTGEQADHGAATKDIIGELRRAVGEIKDADLAGEVIRNATRQLAAKGQHQIAVDAAHQHESAATELTAQIGIELLRMDAGKYRVDVEGLLMKLGPADSPGVQTLRGALGKQPPPKKEGEPPTAPPLAVQAEADAIKGNIAGAKAARNVPKAEDKAKALVAVGATLADANPTEAGPLLVDAAKLLKEVKGSVSPWVSVRACYLLAKLGQDAEAEALAAAQLDEASKAWARLGAMRGRLEKQDMKGKKGDDTWLDQVGDPTKFAAAAQAREVLARHNAAQGFAGEYNGAVKKWPTGTVRPFGMAGIVLGQLDRR